MPTQRKMRSRILMLLVEIKWRLKIQTVCQRHKYPIWIQWVRACFTAHALEAAVTSPTQKELCRVLHTWI